MTTKTLKQVFLAVDGNGRTGHVWADKETAVQWVAHANANLLGECPWTVVAMKVSPVMKRVKP